jgi:hypothetical protein
VSTVQDMRTRTFSWEDPAEVLVAGSRLSGLQYLQAIAGGELPPPPIAQLLGPTVRCSRTRRPVA